MKIRAAKGSDLNEVLRVESRAFGQDEESELVRGLLNDPSAAPLLSLLAINDKQAVGHILFTRVGLAGAQEPVSASILAPLAVIPESQRRGVGGKLIEEGLRILSEMGVELVFVLGHPGYYPRFGFKPAGVLGFEAPYPIPEKHADAWMVRELRAGIIGSVRGKVVCADTLSRPEYWRE